jgi:EmrB/QacA subfamily drug resistance transporter
VTHLAKPPSDAIQHGAAAAPIGAAVRTWVLVAAILGSSMAFVDGTVVNVALPAIERELDASAADVQWVVEAYALLLSAFLLVGGSLGDHFGRRRTFAIGVALFAVASVGCALSPDVHLLIAARALQGLGAALLVPGSLALITAAYPEGERGKAIGTWSGASGITAAVGPVLGGYLIDHYSWTWAFLINVPLALAVLVIVILRVPESRGAGAGIRLDLKGAALATLALGAVVFALIEGPGCPHPAGVIVLGVGLGLIATAAFLVVERRVAAPMLPLGLFRDRNFAGANLLTLLLYAALGGSLYFFPLDLIQVQGYSATAAGAALLPFVLILFVLSRWAGGLVDRYGSKRPLMIGPVIAAIGFAMFALPGVDAGPSRYALTFLPAVIVLGAGMTVTIAPLTTTVMNALGPSLAGVASGVNNAVSRAAGLLAIALFGILVRAAFDSRLDAGLHAVQAPAPVVEAVLAQRDKLAGLTVAPAAGVDPALVARLQREVKFAYVAGFRRTMLAAALLALLGAVIAWKWVEDRPPSG